VAEVADTEGRRARRCRTRAPEVLITAELQPRASTAHLANVDAEATAIQEPLRERRLPRYPQPAKKQPATLHSRRSVLLITFALGMFAADADNEVAIAQADGIPPLVL
jgi:hypothetical protein